MNEYPLVNWLVITRISLFGSLFLLLVGCGRPEPVTVAESEVGQSPSQALKPASLETLRGQVSTVPANVEATRDIQYAVVGDVALSLDLYVPRQHSDVSQQQNESVPLLIWIHGGGWSNGNKDWCPLVWMSEHGFAVASIQYRLSDEATFPAQIHDCKGAIRWLRAHAHEYGFDPDAVGVAGISAGGQLASLVATSGGENELEGQVGGNLDQSSRVQAVIDMCGTTDFLLVLEDFPEYSARTDTNTARLFGGPLAENSELARLASSVYYVNNGDPPLLILHGENDALVPLIQSYRLRDQYRDEDLDVSLSVIPGGEHVPREFWDSERQTLALAFFNEHLKTDR